MFDKDAELTPEEKEKIKELRERAANVINVFYEDLKSEGPARQGYAISCLATIALARALFRAYEKTENQEMVNILLAGIMSLARDEFDMLRNKAEKGNLN